MPICRWIYHLLKSFRMQTAQKDRKKAIKFSGDWTPQNEGKAPQNDKGILKWIISHERSFDDSKTLASLLSTQRLSVFYHFLEIIVDSDCSLCISGIKTYFMQACRFRTFWCKDLLLNFLIAQTTVDSNSKQCFKEIIKMKIFALIKVIIMFCNYQTRAHATEFIPKFHTVYPRI